VNAPHTSSDEVLFSFLQTPEITFCLFFFHDPSSSVLEFNRRAIALPPVDALIRHARCWRGIFVTFLGFYLPRAVSFSPPGFFSSLFKEDYPPPA